MPRNTSRKTAVGIAVTRSVDGRMGLGAKDRITEIEVKGGFRLVVRTDTKMQQSMDIFDRDGVHKRTFHGHDLLSFNVAINELLDMSGATTVETE